MNSATIFLIGRIVFAIYWLMAAYSHLFGSKNLIGYAQFKGVKHAKVAVIGTGILLLIGGVSMLTGDWPNIGIAALVVFLAGTSYKMHAYWKETDPTKKMTERVSFMKNVALAAALVMMVAIATPWPFRL